MTLGRLALGALGALAVAHPGHAAVYSTSATYTLSYTTFSTLVVDWDTTPTLTYYGGAGVAGLATYTAAEMAVSFSGSAPASAFYGQTADSYYLYFTGALGPGSPYAYVTGAGTTIDGTSPWYAASTETSGLTFIYLSVGSAWGPGTSGYLALKLSKGAYSYYGWLALTIEADLDHVVGGFAWESTPGVGITTPVPEPGASGLLALAAGAVGLGRWRRRRASVSAVGRRERD